MQMRIIAVGSSKWDRFIRRRGVSFLIGEDTLFDTFGDPGVFLNNARRMQIDFSRIRHIVLSHDDWDHISGLQYIINRYKKLTVYICPNFKQEVKERVNSFGINILQVSGSLQIKENVYSTGQLYSRSEERDIYEQALVVRSQEGLNVVTGCAHPGIIKIIEHVKNQFNEPVRLIIGGFHLKNNTVKQIQEVISNLKSSGISKVAPTHCTGKIATMLFQEKYGDDFIKVKAGQTIGA